MFPYTFFLNRNKNLENGMKVFQVILFSELSQKYSNMYTKNLLINNSHYKNVFEKIIITNKHKVLELSDHK